MDEPAEAFDDRRAAGRQLAAVLAGRRLPAPVVLALPRGGVPVGYEIARALDAPLDVIVVRKLRAPSQPELGIGAVVDGEQPLGVLNADVVGALDVTDVYLKREVDTQLAEIRRREAAYRRGREPIGVAGRTVIVVDDGLATGGTMRAAVRSLRRAGAARIVLAVPVAAPESLADVEGEVDETVCLVVPDEFAAVGQFYRDFTQTTDEEVVRLLAASPRAELSA